MASERHKQDTLRGNTIENLGYLFVYYIRVDVRMPLCTLTLTFFVFASWSTPSQASTNRIFRLSDPVSFNKI